MIVFYPAQTADGCGPDRSVRMDLHLCNPAWARLPLRRVRCADLPVLDKSNATIVKTEPETISPRIVGHGRSLIRVPQAGPGCSSHLFVSDQVYQALLL